MADIGQTASGIGNQASNMISGLIYSIQNYDYSQLMPYIPIVIFISFIVLLYSYYQYLKKQE